MDGDEIQERDRRGDAGAVPAGVVLNALLFPSIAAFEAEHGIVRGRAQSVATVICLLAPLMQAGLSPASDLGSRLVAPVVGAVGAARFFTGVVEPAMRDTADRCGCKGGKCF